MKRKAMQILFAALVAGAAGWAARPAPAAEPPADLLLTRAKVWTAEADRPWAEAVAIRGDRIVYVGAAGEAEALRGPRTEIVDLGGRLVLPGFNDAHVHLFSGALSLERVDLIEDDSVAAVQARIRAFAAQEPKSPWVLGRGWLYGSFPGGLPTRDQLDAVVADRPAYMECYDGHTGWANSKALAVAGIARETKDPENGEIVRDPRTGEPTGVLKESATALVESRIPVPTGEARYGLLLRALRLLASQGITSIQDAGFALEDLEADVALLERARAGGALTVRVRAAVRMGPGEVEPAVAAALRLRGRHDDAFLRIDSVKGYVDGVVESKTAAMLEPYPGGGTGMPNWSPEALAAAAVAADRSGLQVWLHAIGDRGVRMALDAHEAALRANGREDRRGRIEHIETISPADYPRFAALGVIASMQPLHANPDQNNESVWARNAGPDRAGRGFSWGSLERAGARLAFGSDWPVVTSDVRRGLYCAVTRRTREGRPPGGWLPEQAVSLASALRHYTIDGAWASFEEGAKGSLAVGKLADLVVLSEDLFEAPPETILRAKVQLTVVGGRVVHRDGL
ncbi:MAG TPA: amidohydrolase [Vicinamibacteria bacterium]|nr:amidohydrolase [Vicinamibacteria bacterium]